MRIHALEASAGLTYAEMGRFATENGDAKGTNDAAQAAKDDKGQPVSNSARNLWVTETALSTALNVSYMAEQLSLFSLVVGIALLLAGVGFIVLAYAACVRRHPERPPPHSAHPRAGDRAHRSVRSCPCAASATDEPLIQAAADGGAGRGAVLRRRSGRRRSPTR